MQRNFRLWGAADSDLRLDKDPAELAYVKNLEWDCLPFFRQSNLYLLASSLSQTLHIEGNLSKIAVQPPKLSG